MSKKRDEPRDDDAGDAGGDAVSPVLPVGNGHGPAAASAVAAGGYAGLTPRQGQAVEAMLREPTVARAAAAAGVNERTLRRWLAEPGFRAALLAARREAFGQAIGLTQRYAPVAVATLVKVMNDAGAAASARVTAAGVLLRLGREGIELDDLADRVAALERAAAMPVATVVTPPPEDDE